MTDLEIIEFYKTHSRGDTLEFSKLTVNQLNSLLKRNKIKLHSPSESIKLYAKYHQNGFKAKSDKKWEEFYIKYPKEVFESYYYANGKKETLEHFNLTLVTFNKVCKHYNTKKLTSKQSLELEYIKQYGSIEKGYEIRNAKVRKTMTENNLYEISKQKRFNTNINKYGGISPFCSDDVKLKSKKTCLDKYGVDNVFKLDSIQEKARETSSKNHNGIGWTSEEVRNKYINTMVERYGVEWGCMTKQCTLANKGYNSNPNKQFAYLLESNTISYEREFKINLFSYDFKIGNTLIEINPFATHNSTWGLHNQNGKEKDYHYNKTILAKENGYRCIHIWDWDSEDKIINLLLPKTNKIFARQCKIKEITNKESKQFLNQYHLQNYVNSKINIGLYYNNELIEVMTFGKPRYNKKYEYELLRLCTKPNYLVVGGTERLFTYFKKIYQPSSIISYCDNSKFNGEVYSRLGFTLKEYVVPSKHWYNIKTGKHITDNLLRQQGFDRLLGKEYGCYGKGTSNEELMLKHNFVEIYDSGQSVYTYKVN